MTARNNNADRPLVSVFMVTYNHEKFIAQAVDSVLSQKVDFPLELVIGEDCSKDGTGAILRRYEKRDPRVRILWTQRNLGAGRNVCRTHAACRGTYVAMLEGDDFWVDEYKLAKQVDYLEREHECSMCFHRVRHCLEDGTPTDRLFPLDGQKALSGFEDLLKCNFIQTCSVLFRRKLLPVMPRWFETQIVSDWPLFMLLSSRGSIAYLNEVMAHYRLHGGGVWSSNKSAERSLEQHARIWEHVLPEAPADLRAATRRQCIADYWGLANLRAENGRRMAGLRAAVKAVSIRPTPRECLRLGGFVARNWVPRLYKILRDGT